MLFGLFLSTSITKYFKRVLLKENSFRLLKYTYIHIDTYYKIVGGRLKVTLKKC